MLVLQHEAMLQRLLHYLLFRLVVPVGAIGDDGPQTPQAEALLVGQTALFQANTGQPVRTGYQPVNLAQCLRSSASSVLDGRRFSNRRWGRRWRRWSGNRLVGGRFCLGLIQNTVHLRLELAIHGPRFPIEVLGLGVRPDGFLSEKSFPNFGGRFAVVQRPSRPLPEVSPVLPGKITQPHRAALAPPDAFRTLPYAGQEFLQGGGEHWPFYFRRTPRL